MNEELEAKILPPGSVALGRLIVSSSQLVPLARDLLAELGARAEWLVHCDFHHYNILRHGAGFGAVDPKPYLAAFVAAGLEDFRIRTLLV